MQNTAVKKTKLTAQEKSRGRRQWEGVIVSTKMSQTAAVKVTSVKVHPIYKKRYHVSKKYLAHNPEDKFQVGDKVIIEETRPLSKRKHWIIVGVVEKPHAAKKAK